jgi:hypothetical protein
MQYLHMKNRDFWEQFPNGTQMDIYTCKACGQPLYVRSVMAHYRFSHQRWHECQPDHIPDPIAGWLGEDNEYMLPWKEDLVLWTLQY